MDIKRAVEFGREFIKKYPQHKAEVLDYFELMKDEISEGGNTDHEIELFMGACEDLLTEEKYAKGGLVGYKPLYLLFSEGNTAPIRLFKDKGHNDYRSLGDIGFYKNNDKYQMSRIDISDSMSYELVDTLKIMTKVMSYLKDKVGSYASIIEVLDVLKGEELIVADIGGGQTYFLPKSYIGYHVFNVYEKGRDSLYSRIFAPNTLKAQKMLDVKMKSYGGANRYDLQSTGNTVRNSRTDIQFAVGGNMEDKYYGGGAIDFGSNYTDYSIGGL